MPKPAGVVYNEEMRPKQTLLTHLYMSFGDAFRGLKNTWHEERNFRIGVCISLLTIIVLIAFDFSYIDIVFAIFTMMLVLGAEVINTAFEDTLNKIEPNFDPAIGKAKDIAAGIVVLNVLGALLIAIIVAVHHFSF